MKAYYFRLAGTIFMLKILAFSEQEAWNVIPIVGQWCGAEPNNCQLARVKQA